MRRAAVTDAHVVVPWAARGTVVVSFDGSYVWSFSSPRDARASRTGWRVEWPETLRTRLAGTTHVRLEGAGGTYFDAPVTFAGAQDPLTLEDRHGHRLAV